MGEGCDDYIGLSLSTVRREATALTAKMVGKSSFTYTWPKSDPMY